MVRQLQWLEICCGIVRCRYSVDERLGNTNAIRMSDTLVALAHNSSLVILSDFQTPFTVDRLLSLCGSRLGGPFLLPRWIVSIGVLSLLATFIAASLISGLRRPFVGRLHRVAPYHPKASNGSLPDRVHKRRRRSKLGNGTRTQMQSVMKYSVTVEALPWATLRYLNITGGCRLRCISDQQHTESGLNLPR